MKKKFRSLLALVMALAMVLALTACGSSSTDTDTVEEDASVTSEEDEGVVVYDIDSSTSYVEDFGEDTSADYEEEPLYIEVAVGDVLYSDDNCSITLASVETNEKGGTTVTLHLDGSCETSLAIDVSAYDTDKYNTFLEKDAAGKKASVTTEEDLSYIMVADETEEGNEWIYEFSGEYVYFAVSIETYSELLTKEQVDSGEYVEVLDQLVYFEDILVNAAE